MAGMRMRTTELSPAWIHGIAMAICFCGWMGLTLFFDGIRNTEQATHALAEAVLFTSLMAGIDLGIYAYRRWSDRISD